MQIYKSKKIWHPQASPGYAPVDILKIVIDIYLPSYRFWRSTLIDLGSPRKKLCGHQNYPPPPPRYAYFRACLKKYGGPLHRFFWGPPPQRFAPPPPGKIPAGAHGPRAYPGFGRGGQDFFFQIWKFACREALLGGSGACPPRENFLKWCNLVRFGVYLDQILSLKNIKNYHFLYKIFKNYYFLYKIFLKLHFLYKKYSLDTRLLSGNSHEEIFENIL